MTSGDPIGNKAVSDSPGTAVRRADVADIGAMTDTLARAFADDPLVCFLLPDPAVREEKIVLLFRLLSRLCLPFSACDVTSGFESVALWLPPQKSGIGWRQRVVHGPDFLNVFGRDIFHAIRTMNMIERKHPHEPHWYLQAIGTDPERQGRGFGSLLMRHQLAFVDAQGLPVYLETSKEKNIPFYESFGFGRMDTIAIPHGPNIYPMWRYPVPDVESRQAAH